MFGLGSGGEVMSPRDEGPEHEAYIAHEIDCAREDAHEEETMKPSDAAMKEARRQLGGVFGGQSAEELATLLDAWGNAKLEEAALMLDEEHDRCFRQEHAVEKSAGQHADMIRKLKVKS